MTDVTDAPNATKGPIERRAWHAPELEVLRVERSESGTSGFDRENATYYPLS